MTATLHGRSALVTGGGRGIGAAVAAHLADLGASVVVTARTETEIGAVASDIVTRGGSAVAVPCDVTDADQIQSLADRLRSDGRTIDILVNNAGVADSAPLHRITLENWNRLLLVNATAPFLVTQAFLPAMLEASWGRVVNVASVAGLAGAKYTAAYTSAKHAVVGFTRAVAAEVADRGVTVNAVCPGYVDTSMTERSIARIVEKTGMDPEGARDAILSTSSQHRLIAPQEVAHVVASLCADDAGGVNGQTVVIDGGSLAS
jgi:NAD(P)-dependent dehydrogenase (short-subunit alcohol dehydrogenase family)